MAEQRTDPSAIPTKNEVVPRYLRPSSGSCHDLCKYGRKHVFEEKPWKSSMKRTAKPSHSELAPVEIFILGEPKKEKLLKHKLSIDTNKHSLNLKLSPGFKSLSPKPKISFAKSHPRQNASFGDNKRLLKFKSSFVRKSFSPDPPEVIKREILPPSKQVEVLVQEGSLTDTKPSRNKTRTGYQSDKQSPSLRSKLVKVKIPLSSGENLDGKGRRNGDVETGGKMTDLKVSARKALTSSAAPLSPKVTRNKKASTVITRKTRSSKLASPMKDQNRLLRVETKTSDDENVPEKTLHVIETGTRTDSLDSISDDMSHGKSPSSLSHEKHDNEIDHNDGDAELVLSDNGPVTNEKLESVTENGKKTLIKNRVIHSEDKYRSPVKLKFRSGKVVDFMSDNNNPRRLKFRKQNINVGAATGKVDVSTRTYKKTGDDGATDAKLSSEKVVLKHQDVQGKKDDQLLFNNVIKETASKLVKSRKSKVKALVGAFETVISLQEKTPSSHPLS